MIIDVKNEDLPLCPNTDNELHRLQVRLQDAAYNSQEKDENLEFVADVAELNTMYEAISGSPHNGRMFLYREGVTLYTPVVNRVEAWYFRCSTCGLVIPATAHQ